MLVDEIDAIRLQTFQRGFNGFANVHGTTVGSRDRFTVEREAELGRNDNLVPLALEAPAEKLFIGKRTIGFGGVEKSAAEFDRAIESGRRFSVVGRAVSVAHAHAAETDT